MSIRLITQAIGLFAVTNIDDIVILALFFGQSTARGAVLRVVAGQYLGFAAILAASVVGALGAGLLPESAIPYLGLLRLALGLRAAWSAWREHGARSQSFTDDSPPPAGAAVSPSSRWGGHSEGSESLFLPRPGIDLQRFKPERRVPEPRNRWNCAISSLASTG